MLVPGIHKVVLADVLAGWFALLVPGIHNVFLADVLAGCSVGPWDPQGCAGSCFGGVVRSVGPWNPNGRTDRCFGRVHSVGP